MMNISLTFSQEQLRVIDEALQQLPYYKAAPVIVEINRQIAQQVPPAAQVQEVQK